MTRQIAPLDRFRVHARRAWPTLSLPVGWARLMARYRGALEQHRRMLLAWQVLYLIAFLGFELLGAEVWPAGPDLIVVWLLGFAILTAQGVRFLRDWTPFLVLVLAYMALPGLTPGLLQRVHIGFPVTVDRWLGRGQLPTLRLQAFLWDGGQLHWYDFLATVLYLLHFLIPLVLAFCFWLWRRPLYWRFVRTYLVLMYTGFLIYLIYPMAPPWWASEQGRIPAVQPVLSQVHWHGLGNPIGMLSATFHPDEVAAMPSLHAAFSLLVCLVLWQLWPRWGRLVVLYPLAMGFAVIYSGDHYLIDVLAGWLLAAVVFALVWRRGREQPAEQRHRSQAPLSR
jgi:membrane-associated phospholipid phosphatase